MAAVAERLSGRPSQEVQLFPIRILVPAVKLVTGDAGDPSLPVESHVSRNGHGRDDIHRMGQPPCLSMGFPVAAGADSLGLVPERQRSVPERKPGVAIGAPRVPRGLMNLSGLSGSDLRFTENGENGNHRESEE